MCLQALLNITTVDLTDKQNFAVTRQFYDYFWSYYHDRLTVKAATHENHSQYLTSCYQRETTFISPLVAESIFSS